MIKVNQFDNVAKDKLDQWIYFLKNEEIKQNFDAKGLEKAKEVLDILKLNDEQRAEYERYVADLRYQASMHESTYVCGKREGKLEEKLNNAKSLLDILDEQTIAEKLGLTLEQVRQLK